jgi:hypothetical protein
MAPISVHKKQHLLCQDYQQTQLQYIPYKQLTEVIFGFKSGVINIKSRVHKISMIKAMYSESTTSLGIIFVGDKVS